MTNSLYSHGFIAATHDQVCILLLIPHPLILEVQSVEIYSHNINSTKSDSPVYKLVNSHFITLYTSRFLKFIFRNFLL